MVEALHGCSVTPSRAFSHGPSDVRWAVDVHGDHEEETMNQTLLTQTGYERLAGQCARLRVERDRAAERVRHSLEFGGVAAENADYLDARQELELLGRMPRSSPPDATAWSRSARP
jgi:hypothetical protein